MDLLKLFRRSPKPVEGTMETEVKPVFHKKYKEVVVFTLNDRSPGMIDWVHDHTNNRSVELQFKDNKVYLAFEDENDALIFKIKFL